MQIALSQILFTDSKYTYLFVTTHSPFVLYEMDNVNLVRIYSERKINSITVKPLTFRMKKSANYPYHLLIMIYSFYIYAGTASFGGSHPNAFNFFKYAWIFRSALN